MLVCEMKNMFCFSRQLLVGLVTSFRYGGAEINPKLAKTEADILHESIKEKKGNHEEAIRILTTRSKTQLLATFNRYRDDHGISITKVKKSSSVFYNLFLFSRYFHVHKNSYHVLDYRNCWIMHLMIFTRHCTLRFDASMTIRSTMKRLISF